MIVKTKWSMIKDIRQNGKQHVKSRDERDDGNGSRHIELSNEILCTLIRPLIHPLGVNQSFRYFHLDISQSINGPCVNFLFICLLRNAFLWKVAQPTRGEHTWWSFTTRLNFYLCTKAVFWIKWILQFIVTVYINCSSMALPSVVDVWRFWERPIGLSFSNALHQVRLVTMCLLFRWVTFCRQLCWLGGCDWHWAIWHEYSERIDRRRWYVRKGECFSSVIVIPMWRFFFLIFWNLFSLF
jgi:hypothetical protein